jgi:hypothetical protein
VRRLWHRLEHLHAVTYFAPECREAHARAGLKGFWMGYFASRAAPLGPVGPGIVEALFFNFAPAMVRRAIPDAWDYVRPGDLVIDRAEAAAVALRAHGGVDDALARAVLPPLHHAVASAPASGRTLFGANRDLEVLADPVADLWQAVTALREHRGDGHVAALLAQGFSGPEPHLLIAADQGADDELFRASRGWEPDEWLDARARLVERGLLRPDGALSDEGWAARQVIEGATDALAATAYGALGTQVVEDLTDALESPARALAGSGIIPFPNPMGLPPID